VRRDFSSGFLICIDEMSRQPARQLITKIAHRFIR